MKNRKITGRHQNRKLKSRMKRQTATLLALMISTSSVGTVTAYADEVTVYNGKVTSTESSQTEDQNSQSGTVKDESSVQGGAAVGNS